MLPSSGSGKEPALDALDHRLGEHDQVIAVDSSCFTDGKHVVRPAVDLEKSCTTSAPQPDTQNIAYVAGKIARQVGGGLLTDAGPAGVPPLGLEPIV